MGLDEFTKARLDRELNKEREESGSDSFFSGPEANIAPDTRRAVHCRFCRRHAQQPHPHTRSRWRCIRRIPPLDECPPGTGRAARSYTRGFARVSRRSTRS